MSHKISKSITQSYYFQKSLVLKVEAGKIPPSLARKVLHQYEKMINYKVLNKHAPVRLSFKGELSNFNFCDKVWTFGFRNVEIRGGDTIFKLDSLILFACDAKLND